jgi:hypothetical protein
MSGICENRKCVEYFGLKGLFTGIIPKNEVTTFTSRVLVETVLLTLTLLTWRIWWAPTNVSKWRMGFNSAFKGLIIKSKHFLYVTVTTFPFSSSQEFASGLYSVSNKFVRTHTQKVEFCHL